MSKTFPTLYKLCSNGKVQQWTLTVNDRKFLYSIEYGYTDGKKQTKETLVKSGKNVGRANATSRTEQLYLEAESAWTKQIDRKGYTKDIPQDRPFLPMLAKNFEKDYKHINYPCYVSAKLDGVRCIAFRRGKDVILLSRTGKRFTGLPHIEKALSGLPEDLVLDGELFTPALTFQEVISIVRKDKVHTRHEEILFYVFDIIDEKLDFSERYKDISWIIDRDSSGILKLVKCELVDNREAVDEKLQQYLAEGMEGLMLRNLKGGYKLNGRSKDLQKYKKFQDAEFKIVDIVENSKQPGMGVVVCSDKENNTFKATPKMSEPEKRDLLRNKDSYIGRMAIVKFFELTTSVPPLPRFPIYIGIRDYE